MKKILILLGLALLLTSCGGGNSDSGTVQEDPEAFFHLYKTAEFSIKVPDEWETINSFGSEYPSAIRIAFRNKIKEGDYIANLSVFKEENPKQLSNADLSQKYLKSHGETLDSYKLLEREEITLKVLGSPSSTVINTFEGKKSASDATITYMQTYLAEGDLAWVVSASYSAPSEDVFTIAKLEEMLKSFNLY